MSFVGKLLKSNMEYTWQSGGHFFYSRNPYHLDLIEEIPSDNISKEETIMKPKFMIGDRAFYIPYGVVTINNVADYGVFPICVKWLAYNIYFMADGKFRTDDENPLLLTLEEARAHNYDIPKQLVKKYQWMYCFKDSQQFGITSERYSSVREAIDQHISSHKITFLYPLQESMIEVEE